MTTVMLIKDQLYAFQSLEYEPGRFLGWILRNPFCFNLEKKKKLVYTAKAKFLLFTATLIPILLSLTSLFYPEAFVSVPLIIISYLFFPWIYLITSQLVLKLYELPNRWLTINAARTRLSQNPNLIVIGITGSFGKTTTKEILSTLLAKKYKVLSPPQSYNTLFAVAKIIKEQLKEDHQVFLVEMGAYKRGEIAELCRVVKPKIGILTGITNQHLERFGSEENIAKAKYELIESLPNDGLAVFNLDSENCRPLYEKTAVNKFGYSVQDPDGRSDLQRETWPACAGRQSQEGQTFQEKRADVLAKISETTTRDIKFNIFIPSNQLLRNDQPSARSPKGRLILQENLVESFTLNVPGEHNISNALAAIAVALYLNVPTDKIRDALAEVKSPEHRLQIITNPDGTIIIDDSYSSNTEGIRAAINLAKKFTNKPKIIVTPGLVELGKVQFEENKSFGKLISENFDYAVIVNKTNRQPILEGLLARGWRRQNTSTQPKLSSSNFATIALKTLESQKVALVVDSLKEATKDVIPNLVKPGSLILFENDLPDIYA